eukprot:CAMPEP_0196573596 /NCGR_PEP_ID=MMETSP1081-20130531/3479_1 /TAXON_ID=36882 /ORGANISM="Pyramimonas amylifera, Strain CCMP720" /LENGTH=260 /DNA_ID=CAMNT_0041891365 /DNA_START=460 /DNA_END=1242 /DNA_ORIENTATION=-
MATASEMSNPLRCSQDVNNTIAELSSGHSVNGKIPDLTKFCQRLCRRGYAPKHIVDIGAHWGSWSTKVQRVFSNSNFHMMEANPQAMSKLQRTKIPYEIALLGEREESVTYYSNPSASTGNSVFREATQHFDEKNRAVSSSTRQQTTLDALLGYPNEPKFTVDFLKIDAQGSELNILRGGQNVLKGVSVLLLECSILQYNRGAPLAGEVISWLHSKGFVLHEILEFNRLNNVLFQVDFAFIRKEHFLFENAHKDAKITIS